MRTAAAVTTVLAPSILLATLLASGAVTAFSPMVVVGPLVPAALAAMVGGAIVAREGRPAAGLARVSKALGALATVAIFSAFGAVLAHNGIGVVGARALPVTSMVAFFGLFFGLPTAAIVAGTRHDLGARLQSLVQSWVLLGLSAAVSGGVWWRLGRGREQFAELPVWGSKWSANSFPDLVPLTATQDTAMLCLGVLGVALFLAALPALGTSRKIDAAALDQDLSAW